MQRERVVVIGAHPDDELLGAGGTLARHVLAGDEVHAIVVADGSSQTKTNVAAMYAPTPMTETGTTTARSLAGGSTRRFMSPAGCYQVKLPRKAASEASTSTPNASFVFH